MATTTPNVTGRVNNLGSGWSSQKYYDPSTGQYNTISYDNNGSFYVSQVGNDTALQGYDAGTNTNYASMGDGNYTTKNLATGETQGRWGDTTINGDSSGTLNGLSTGLQGIQALSGLANAYTGLKGLGLAEDQFAFSKAGANKDVANQAKLINNNILNSAQVSNALAGNTLSDTQKTAALATAKSKYVDGSKIG